MVVDMIGPVFPFLIIVIMIALPTERQFLSTFTLDPPFLILKILLHLRLRY